MLLLWRNREDPWATDDGMIRLMSAAPTVKEIQRVFEFWHEHHWVEGISHAALIPHWEKVEKRLNVEQAELEQVNANNMVTWRGAEKLGWKADLLRRNVKNCAHTGYCGMGCPIDAKQSMLVTMIPDAVRAGAPAVSARPSAAEKLARLARGAASDAEAIEAVRKALDELLN